MARRCLIAMKVGCILGHELRHGFSSMPVLVGRWPRIKNILNLAYPWRRWEVHAEEAEPGLGVATTQAEEDWLPMIYHLGPAAERAEGNPAAVIDRRHGTLWPEPRIDDEALVGR